MRLEVKWEQSDIPTLTYGCEVQKWNDMVQSGCEGSCDNLFKNSLVVVTRQDRMKNEEMYERFWMVEWTRE